jgi:hypothetical protein
MPVTARPAAAATAAVMAEERVMIMALLLLSLGEAGLGSRRVIERIDDPKSCHIGHIGGLVPKGRTGYPGHPLVRLLSF